MKRHDMPSLMAFMTIAERKSFRAAAAELGVSPSALSHSMRQLEESLGVRLLNRTTRSVSVTDAGRRLLDQLRPAFDQVSSALMELDRERIRPVGRLRIYAANQLAASVAVMPICSDFLSRYPEVELELHVGDAAIDLVAQGYDAGIGPLDRAQADMIATRITRSLKMVMVASPEYIARHSEPQTPDELAEHNCIRYRLPVGGAHHWPLVKNGSSLHVAVHGRLVVNEADMATQAAVHGVGIAYTTESLAEPYLRTGHLVRVLDDWAPQFDGFSVFYPDRLRPPSSLVALIGMIRARNGLEKDWSSATLTPAVHAG